MSYRLGIDVGGSSIVAAVCRDEPGQRPQLEVVPLGARSALARSVIYLGQDGELVIGEAAERRAAAEPDRVVREFPRRIGDGAPVVVGGVRYSAADLFARVARWVVDRVAQREGGPAQGISLTHPASWDAHKIQVVADALAVATLPAVSLCTAPQAAAASYSRRERIDVGGTLAVYDLGGSSFETAVVRRTSGGRFSIVGVPQGIEQLGGSVFDEAVFGHVIAAVPVLGELEPEATGATPLQRSFTLCRLECTEAKEKLSVDTEVRIPVLLPRLQSQVCLARTEFEDLIRPHVEHTVEAMRRALRSAGVDPGDLDAVLLVGGSSRVPLVAQRVSAELGRPVVVDDDPQAAIALGAALSELPAGAHPAGIDAAPVTMRSDTQIVTSAAVTGTAESVAPDPAATNLPPWLAATQRDATPLDTAPLGTDPPDAQWHPRTSRRFVWYAAGFVGLVIAGGAVAVLLMMSAHHGVAPAPVVRIPAPATPASQIPAPQIPVPQTPVDQTPVDQAPLNGDLAGALPPAPTTTPGGTVRSRPTAPPTGADRATPAPTTPPPPTTHVPDWVSSARG